MLRFSILNVVEGFYALLFEYWASQKGARSDRSLQYQRRQTRCDGMKRNSISYSLEKKIVVVNSSVTLEGQRIFGRHSCRWVDTFAFALEAAGCQNVN
jgi:hypothetical protein